MKKPEEMTDAEYAEHVASGKTDEMRDPMGSSTALAKLVPGGGKTLARRTAGQLPPDEMRFHCSNCGENKTLKFEKDEIEALNGDISEYTGPCWGCGTMMLMPYDSLWGSEFPSMHERAREAKRQETKEMVHDVVEAVTDKVGGMIPGMGKQPAAAPAEDAPTGAPDRSDLPAADDVNVDELKPR